MGPTGNCGCRQVAGKVVCSIEVYSQVPHVNIGRPSMYPDRFLECSVPPLAKIMSSNNQKSIYLSLKLML